MKGFISKNTLRLALSGSCLVSLLGCYHYRELVDPCWPERYNAMARHSVREMHYAQAERGHMLEQTIWNWHFDTDKVGAPTDRLNGAGMEVLSRIARTLPAPDFQLYLQNARDIPDTDGMPADKLVAKRHDLNKLRTYAILRYLATQITVSGMGTYQVAVHDYTSPGQAGAWTTFATEGTIEKNLKTGIRQPFPAPEYSTK